MRVLVIGQGGREHALVRAFALSPSVSEIHAIPGNAGMRKNALCHSIAWQDSESLIQFCLRGEIDFVFIGPDEVVAAGLADRLRERGILVVGPGADGARLESSKVFAKKFMQEAGIPTARFEVVNSVESTLAASEFFQSPYVLKADGLAAGKGVLICKDLAELKKAAQAFFEQRIFQEASDQAVLEQFTPGWEMSYTILTNGHEFSVLPIAQDHKRLLENNQGPNTGGMGTFAPVAVSDSLRESIETTIVAPTLKTLRQRGISYRGVIFFGIMMTDSGPSLLEFNCRLGDPETQVMLPLIDGDWGQICKQMAEGKVTPIRLKKLFASCVIMAAPGYPSKPEKGLPIAGNLQAETDSSYFIHAGTACSEVGAWTVQGGRVLGAVGLGSSLSESLNKSYAQASQVSWPGLQMRKDIGQVAPGSSS